MIYTDLKTIPATYFMWIVIERCSSAAEGVDLDHRTPWRNAKGWKLWKTIGSSALSGKMLGKGLG